MEKCIGVEWELEQICDASLLANQVVKVVYSYLKSLAKQENMILQIDV